MLMCIVMLLILLTIPSIINFLPMKKIVLLLMSCMLMQQTQAQTTDANGRVNFKGENPDESYSVGYPNGADYFGDGTSLQKGKNKPVVLYIYPFAYVRVHAKNVTPYDNNDRINIGGGGFLYGANIDTTLIQGPFQGTQNGGFGWNVIKNNISTDISIQLYFIGRDTIDYTINY